MNRYHNTVSLGARRKDYCAGTSRPAKMTFNFVFFLTQCAHCSVNIHMCTNYNIYCFWSTAIYFLAGSVFRQVALLYTVRVFFFFYTCSKKEDFCSTRRFGFNVVRQVFFENIIHNSRDAGA